MDCMGDKFDLVWL